MFFSRAADGPGSVPISNVLIDPAAELRALEYAQRLTHRARNVLAAAPGHSTGHDLFLAALSGGAQALGIATTGLCAGASADIVGLDPEHPALIGRRGNAILDSWIFAGGGIDCVWRRGAQQVSGGRHRLRDRIEAKYRQAILGLLA